MQVIYAAPFILLSLISFVFSLAFSRLRPYAFRALVAPVAFGFCSIVAMVLILLASHGLGFRFDDSPLAGLTGFFVGVFIYFTPGLIGSWIAVEIVRQIEIRLLKGKRQRDLATRIIAALIVFGPSFIVCTALQFKLFLRAEEFWFLCLMISFVLAGVTGALTCRLLKTLQDSSRVGRNANVMLWYR